MLRTLPIRCELGTMLDEDGIVSARVCRSAMGADASASLASCLAETGEVRNLPGESCTGLPISFPSADVAHASVRRHTPPAGTPPQRFSRLFRSQQPVPLSVIFGTGDLPSDLEGAEGPPLFVN